MERVVAGPEEEYLERLKRMQRDCLIRISDAESRGDLNEARTIQLQLRTLLTMIERKGHSA